MDGRGRLVSRPGFVAFPYREEDPVQLGPGPPVLVRRPTLPLRLQFGSERWSVRALVDTGAPFTLFDRATGDALNVDFSRDGARREFHKVAGREYLAQVERVRLTIPAFGDDLQWETEVWFFLEDWEMPFAGLLGQEGFLDKWVVSFDYPKSFVIEERSSYESRLPVLTPEEVSEIWEWQELGWKGPPTS